MKMSGANVSSVLQTCGNEQPSRIKIPSRNETYTEKSSKDQKKYGLGSSRVEKTSDIDKQMCLRAPLWIKHQPGRSFSTQTMLCKSRTGWMTEVSVGAGGNEQNEEANKIGKMKKVVGNCDSGGVLWDTATSSREMCDLMFHFTRLASLHGCATWSAFLARASCIRQRGKATALRRPFTWATSSSGRGTSPSAPASGRTSTRSLRLGTRCTHSDGPGLRSWAWMGSIRRTSVARIFLRWATGKTEETLLEQSISPEMFAAAEAPAPRDPRNRSDISIHNKPLYRGAKKILSPRVKWRPNGYRRRMGWARRNLIETGACSLQQSICHSTTFVGLHHICWVCVLCVFRKIISAAEMKNKKHENGECRCRFHQKLKTNRNILS